MNEQANAPYQRILAAGQCADGLPEGAKDAARAVLNLLTDLDLSVPKVVIEDNEITLEWYKDRHHVAVVSVDGQSISWAVMAGATNPLKGKERFDNEMPSEAYDAIRIVSVA
jgi:hypothetical protein